MAMQKSVALLFPSPIGEFQVEDCAETNAGLRRLILAKERQETSQAYANAGGWHSKTDFLDWKDPAVDIFRSWVVEAVNYMIGHTYQYMQSFGVNITSPPGKMHAQAWANISRYGHYHRSHNHPGHAWSGTYYVDGGNATPDHPLSGLLELPDPRPHANMVATPGNPFGQKVLIAPQPGKMVIFPSWFEHFVHPYFGEGERISIAFNVRLVEEPPGH